MLAISFEPLELVEPYVGQHDLPFSVVAGSSSNKSYGVEGYPQTFLIDPEGKIAWQGHPGGLSKGTVKKVLKGAKRPKGDFLAVRIDESLDPRAAKARELAQDGELSRSLGEVDAILADPAATESQKAAATAVKGRIDAHLKDLAAQAEKLVKSRDVEQAVTVLEALAKQVPAAEQGGKAKKRLAEIAADKKLQREIEAAKALARLRDQIKALKRDKSKPKIEEFIEKHEGTRAAERAAFLLRSTA